MAQFNSIWQTKLLGSFVSSVAISSNGKLIASAQKDYLNVQIWDAEYGTLLYELAGHTDSVTCVAFNPEGTHVVSGSFDKTIKIWNVKKRKLEDTFKCDNVVRSVAFNHEGTHIVSGNDGDKTKDKRGEVIIWNVQTGKKKVSDDIEHYDGSPLTVAFNSAGTVYLAGFDYGGGKMCIYYLDEDYRIGYYESGHSGTIYSAAFIGDKIVSGGDNGLQIWNQDGEWERTLDDDSVSSVALFGDSSVVVGYTEKDFVKIWNVDTGVVEQTFNGTGNKFGAVLSVAVNKEHGLIVFGGEDRKINVWMNRPQLPPQPPPPPPVLTIKGTLMKDIDGDIISHEPFKSDDIVSVVDAEKYVKTDGDKLTINDSADIKSRMYLKEHLDLWTSGKTVFNNPSTNEKLQTHKVKSYKLVIDDTKGGGRKTRRKSKTKKRKTNKRRKTKKTRK